MLTNTNTDNKPSIVFGVTTYPGKGGIPDLKGRVSFDVYEDSAGDFLFKSRTGNAEYNIAVLQRDDAKRMALAILERL